MDGKLCPGIHLPLEIFTPLFQGKPPPPLIQKFFNPPFLKFWLKSQPPLLALICKCYVYVNKSVAM